MNTDKIVDSQIHRINKTKKIFLIFIFLLFIAFVSYEYYDFYVPKKLVLKIDSDNNDIIHTTRCMIVRNDRDIKGVAEYEFVDKTFQGEVYPCPLCAPSFSLSAVYKYRKNLNDELIKLYATEEYDEESIRISDIARINAENNREYTNAYNEYKRKAILSGEYFLHNRALAINHETVFNNIYKAELSKFSRTPNEINIAISNKDRKLWLEKYIPKIDGYLATRFNIFAYFNR